MSQRHHRVKLAREGNSVSEAARTLGISRKTAYKWLWRHERWGLEGLCDRSRARHGQSHETAPSVHRLLVALRKQTGAGPRRAVDGGLQGSLPARGPFYRWTRKFGAMGVSEVHRLKQLEDENAKLKRLVADLSLDKAILQDVLRKNV